MCCSANKQISLLRGDAQFPMLVCVRKSCIVIFYVWSKLWDLHWHSVMFKKMDQKRNVWILSVLLAYSEGRLAKGRHSQHGQHLLARHFDKWAGMPCTHIMICKHLGPLCMDNIMMSPFVMLVPDTWIALSSKPLFNCMWVWVSLGLFGLAYVMIWKFWRIPHLRQSVVYPAPRSYIGFPTIRHIIL